MQEEREERDLRKAEMEANKAENLIEHETDIYSRPARTWFQTEKQKKQVAKRTRDAIDTGFEEGDDDDDEGGNAARQGESSSHAHHMTAFIWEAATLGLIWIRFCHFIWMTAVI